MNIIKLAQEIGEIFHAILYDVPIHFFFEARSLSIILCILLREEEEAQFISSKGIVV